MHVLAGLLGCRQRRDLAIPRSQPGNSSKHSRKRTGQRAQRTRQMTVRGQLRERRLPEYSHCRQRIGRARSKLFRWDFGGCITQGGPRWANRATRLFAALRPKVKSGYERKLLARRFDHVPTFAIPFLQTVHQKLNWPSLSNRLSTCPSPSELPAVDLLKRASCLKPAREIDGNCPRCTFCD